MKRMQYGILYENRKEEYRKEEEKEIRKIKTKTEACKYINMERKRTVRISRSIIGKEWRLLGTSSRNGRKKSGTKSWRININ